VNNDENKSRHYLRIDQKLPSLNDYINECRKHWSKGAAFKRDTEEVISWYIRNAKREGALAPMTGTVSLLIVWHERTRKRDTDNVQSAAKYILDALQGMRIICNDSPKYVDQINHQIERGTADFVEVFFYEAEKQGGKNGENKNPTLSR
jgi:Holliday junction resolvase RusA-like endonuclease